MATSRADFKQRLARLPKRQVSTTYDPMLDVGTLSSALSPLSYLLAGTLGFFLYLFLPYFFLSFADPSLANGEVRNPALDPIWTIPSIGLGFAGSILVQAFLGLTTGGHFRSTAVGIGLGVLLLRAFAG